MGVRSTRGPKFFSVVAEKLLKDFSKIVIYKSHVDALTPMYDEF